MRIRKLFKFENAHIVRNCSSNRCKYSIHGHSYQVELILQANRLDHGQMVYDFGLLKSAIKDIIDSFDHAITFWQKDDPEYIAACKNFSARWVAMPVSPSAEQFSRVIFFWADAILQQTQMQNGESDVMVYSVIVHETATGYAQCFIEDVQNEQMGKLNLADFEFSDEVRAEWHDPLMYDKLISGEKFINPKVALQVDVS
ncbi:6-pyruvoyltetrahydropterin/6-carboxytetrahydropterin synthase [Moraxella cuniculi DSM 21768]|uniref:6-carboxy-5,6,7,8-tetrahydropterin synthase n=1 Tax=Moraxella cuniculi DSM 21768 TaxID=1122245 RepID=A0A1N7FJK8_9GAMM|nr:6-carboxytetrahydropterin synthase [Moraxella cuniculi]OOS02236.1 6-carboxytetrahydropterin synthase QueD [Moraxella cuniculi]SIS00464.1 6-pyruvoyltetrahydropterin/6-carboxytetrahydropterin synthase [Moraxella cuniculi DSM 21768]